MNSASKIAVLILLCMIAGCRHKTPPAPPPAAQAPILPPGTLTKDTPPPELPPADAPNVNLGSVVTNQQPPPKPHHTTTHRKAKPADQAPAQTTAGQSSAPTQQASAGQPPEMSPIGQLSSTGGGGSLPSRHDILDQITATENGLNGIKRTLTADEQVTATQIRTFLTKAKQALEQDDLDGANTLVTKAKVLLGELTKA
jgi:hypothetical protein